MAIQPKPASHVDPSVVETCLSSIRLVQAVAQLVSDPIHHLCQDLTVVLSQQVNVMVFCRKGTHTTRDDRVRASWPRVVVTELAFVDLGVHLHDVLPHVLDFFRAVFALRQWFVCPFFFVPFILFVQPVLFDQCHPVAVLLGRHDQLVAQVKG